MKLKKMFESLKRCKPDRKNYVIKWGVWFEVDDHSYMFSLLPTVIIQPWTYRYPRESVIDIMWLNCHIIIGEWKNKEGE